MLLSNKQQRSLLKLVSLFSLVRGYNIIVLIIAQYLTARYILAPQLSWWTLLFDIKFFSIVIASALTTAAGYIINNFYDASKDQINRPKKYILEHLVSHYERPYIFSNFNGTDHDITVLTHEAGHAFQNYSSSDQPLVNYHWPTMEAAEIHSMSMEFFYLAMDEEFF